MLLKVVLKHLGLEDIVETVLGRMGNVKEIILVGEYAKGNDSGLLKFFYWERAQHGVYSSIRRQN